jgi:hypothetical protein
MHMYSTSPGYCLRPNSNLTPTPPPQDSHRYRFYEWMHDAAQGATRKPQGTSPLPFSLSLEE